MRTLLLQSAHAAALARVRGHGRVNCALSCVVGRMLNTRSDGGVLQAAEVGTSRTWRGASSMMPSVPDGAEPRTAVDVQAKVLISSASARSVPLCHRLAVR